MYIYSAAVLDQVGGAQLGEPRWPYLSQFGQPRFVKSKDGVTRGHPSGG